MTQLAVAVTASSAEAKPSNQAHRISEYVEEAYFACCCGISYCCYRLFPASTGTACKIMRRTVLFLSGLCFGLAFLFLSQVTDCQSPKVSEISQTSHAAIRELLADEGDRRLNRPSERKSDLASVKCSSCGLVGTAGTLLDSGAGTSIDANECVFRLGFSPVRGFENDVGTKTTFRVVDNYRFSPFLKRPEKLASGLYSSEHWLIFGHNAKETEAHRKPLQRFVEKEEDGVRFRWFSKSEEMDATESLKIFGGKLHYTFSKASPSALWYAVKVVEEAGCESLEIYGVPDPKICKNNPNISTRSLYWNKGSQVLCYEGHDTAHSSNKTSLATETPSLAERRALLGWAQRRRHPVTFRHPSWPLLQ